MYVYQLVAHYVCPLTGFDGKPDKIKRTTTVFGSREVAESRIEVFKSKIRQIEQERDDYPIEVEVVALELILE